ncbi:MAG TPA: alpha/beta hydrolase [Microlunatus sp.]
MTATDPPGGEHTSYVDLGDVTLFVHELGRRRPAQPSLLVLHGGPDIGHSYLLPGVRPLCTDHHVVLFDFRGCGRSSRQLPPEDLQPEYVIEDAHRLIRRMGLGRVDLLGFSTGGRAAIRYLQEHPDDVNKIILASTSAYDGSENEPYLRGWDEYRRREIERDAAGKLRNSTIFVWDLDLAPGYLAMINPLDEGDWSYQRHLDGRMHPWLIGDAEETLREAGKPILILHADKDMGFPVQLAQRLHRAVPASTLKIIPDAAHMCQYEKPELWADHIRRFLTAD